jgi:hypothetical protein
MQTFSKSETTWISENDITNLCRWTSFHAVKWRLTLLHNPSAAAYQGFFGSPLIANRMSVIILRATDQDAAHAAAESQAAKEALLLVAEHDEPTVEWQFGDEWRRISTSALFKSLNRRCGF